MPCWWKVFDWNTRLHTILISTDSRQTVLATTPCFSLWLPVLFTVLVLSSTQQAISWLVRSLLDTQNLLIYALLPICRFSCLTNLSMGITFMDALLTARPRLARRNLKRPLNLKPVAKLKFVVWVKTIPICRLLKFSSQESYWPNTKKATYKKSLLAFKSEITKTWPPSTLFKKPWLAVPHSLTVSSWMTWSLKSGTWTKLWWNTLSRCVPSLMSTLKRGHGLNDS